MQNQREQRKLMRNQTGMLQTEFDAESKGTAADGKDTAE